MSTINRSLQKKIRAFGTAAYEKFLCNEIISNWRELVNDSLADNVRPVAIERGVLFVEVASSSYKDQLKFFSMEIVDAINEKFSQDGKPVVKRLRIATAAQIAAHPPTEISKPAQVDSSKLTLEQVTLSKEERELCRTKAAKISDPDLRQTVLETLISQARAQKFHLLKGWHKCASCETLCPPEETFCGVCLIKERATMIEELFKILYDEPWLSPQAAQEILLDKMPHMRRECSVEVVESARTSLIQKVAGRIRFGDEESPDVLKVVMLEKRLPPDKLTPAIIRRTLIDLQFNLADQAQLRRYSLKSSINKRANP